MADPFKFKQFNVNQDRCAMKIGTDGVLLGAWTPLGGEPNTILDIGAGTGIISLMLAQRCAAENIEALEIEGDAYEQCVENFEASPWADRLFCYHAGLDEFVTELDDRYDLIVSNPPFYSEAVSSGNKARDTARQNQSLPFEELLEGVADLLDPDGTFATIIPFKEEDRFLKIAAGFSIYPKRMTRVKGNASTPTKRSMLALGFNQITPKINELVIERDRHQYSKEYIDLTSAFYLKM